MNPLPFGRGEHPTITFVFGSVRNTRSVGPSAQSKSAELLPIGLAALKPRELFSSDDVAEPETTAPVPSSYSVIENVFENPPPSPVQTSFPNSGTLIQRILNAFTFAKPTAITGKVLKSISHDEGLRSAHAGAIFGAPLRNAGTVTTLLVSPTPSVMFPFEFQKNPFHTQPAVPTGPPNTNSHPPDNSPVNGGVPAPSLSSPRNGVFWSSPPAT